MVFKVERKKNVIKISKLWAIMTNHGQKNEQIWGKVLRNFNLPFCFRSSKTFSVYGYLLENLIVRHVFLSIFDSPRRSPLRIGKKVVSFFIFFNSFQVKKMKEGRRERKRKGKEKGKSEVKLWQIRKNRKRPSRESNQGPHFISNFSFHFSFPFPSPLDLLFALKKHTLVAFINYSFSPCMMHNGDCNGSHERSGLVSCVHLILPMLWSGGSATI